MADELVDLGRNETEIIIAEIIPILSHFDLCRRNPKMKELITCIIYRSFDKEHISQASDSGITTENRTISKRDRLLNLWINDTEWESFKDNLSSTTEKILDWIDTIANIIGTLIEIALFIREVVYILALIECIIDVIVMCFLGIGLLVVAGVCIYVAYEVADEIYIYLENCYNTLNDYYKENIDTLNQIFDRLLVVNNQDNLKEVTCNDYTRLNQLVIQYSKRNDCHMQNVLGCQLLTKSEVKSFIKTLYITTVEPFAAIMFGISGASNLVGINEQTIKHYWPLYMNYDHILGLLNGIDCQKPQFRIKYNSVEFPSNVNHSQSITQAIENNNLEVPESTLCTNDINTPSGCVPKFCTGIDTPYRGCTPAEYTGFNTNTHELEPYPECIQTNMCVGIDSDGNLTPEGCIPQQCTGFNTETRELEPYPECIRADCTGFNTETQQLEPYPDVYKQIVQMI